MALYVGLGCGGEGIDSALRIVSDKCGACRPGKLMTLEEEARCWEAVGRSGDICR